MSDPVEIIKSVLEGPELSKAGQNDAEVENDGGRSQITESVENEENAKVENEEDARLHTVTGLDNTSDLMGNSIGQDVFQEITMDLDVPSESQMNVYMQAGLVNQLGTDSKPKTVAVPDDGMACKLGNEKKENGNRILEKGTAEDEKNQHNETSLMVKQEGIDGNCSNQVEGSSQSFSFYSIYGNGDDSGTEEEQNAFMKELENFFKERSLEFKPPKFYGEGLNCLKLWRAVTRLGGYDQVTLCKLWRQVGESFKPPKTCTTVSWSFRCFYEKALLEYEKHKVHAGELQVPIASLSEPISVDNQASGNHASGSGRARRDAAARAMQGWHSQRLLGNGEVGDPVIKDKFPVSLMKRDKPPKSLGAFKRKKSLGLERAAKVASPKFEKSQVDLMVVDVGPRADWVKINVRRTKDCFEVYALVPGLLREETSKSTLLYWSSLFRIIQQRNWTYPKASSVAYHQATIAWFSKTIFCIIILIRNGVKIFLLAAFLQSIISYCTIRTSKFFLGCCFQVHVQSDPAGRLIISGNPEQPDNPWGVTPFKKVVTLPSRIDPHQTSAVVTLHGQLFVRAPFEQTGL